MCFDYNDDHEPLAYIETWRRARKPHKCESCGHAIECRAIYAEASGIDCDGDPFRLRACAQCMAQREAIRQREIAAGCPSYAAVCAIEEIAEHVRDSGMAWVSDEVAAAFAASKYAKGAT